MAVVQRLDPAPSRHAGMRAAFRRAYRAAADRYRTSVAEDKRWAKSARLGGEAIRRRQVGLEGLLAAPVGQHVSEECS